MNEKYFYNISQNDPCVTPYLHETINNKFTKKCFAKSLSNAEFILTHLGAVYK